MVRKNIWILSRVEDTDRGEDTEILCSFTDYPTKQQLEDVGVEEDVSQSLFDKRVSNLTAKPFGYSYYMLDSVELFSPNNI
nr:MAG TPA: NATURAL KILLER CELL PROTEASE 1 (serine protease-inhibitor), protease substrate.2A [Caudoviricetes sp.]